MSHASGEGDDVLSQQLDDLSILLTTADCIQAIMSYYDGVMDNEEDISYKLRPF